MDKLYVKAGEYELKMVEETKFALWEDGEMVNDVQWFKVISDVSDGVFSFDVNRIQLDTCNSRVIDNFLIRNGSIIISGDGLFDCSLQYINNDNSKEIISNVFGVELYWQKNKGLGKFKISQHAFIDNNVLELGQTEEDWLKEKI